MPSGKGIDEGEMEGRKEKEKNFIFSRVHGAGKPIKTCEAFL